MNNERDNNKKNNENNNKERNWKEVNPENRTKEENRNPDSDNDRKGRNVDMDMRREKQANQENPVASRNPQISPSGGGQHTNPQGRIVNEKTKVESNDQGTNS